MRRPVPPLLSTGARPAALLLAVPLPPSRAAAQDRRPTLPPPTILEVQPGMPAEGFPG